MRQKRPSLTHAAEATNSDACVRHDHRCRNVWTAGVGVLTFVALHGAKRKMPQLVLIRTSTIHAMADRSRWLKNWDKGSPYHQSPTFETNGFLDMIVRGSAWALFQIRDGQEEDGTIHACKYKKTAATHATPFLLFAFKPTRTDMTYSIGGTSCSVPCDLWAQKRSDGS